MRRDWVVVICIAIVGAMSQGVAQESKPRRVDIAITADGFSPDRVEVAAGAPVELVFTRKVEKTCATEVTVPSLKINKALPLNEPVSIIIKPEKGEIGFACGMSMLKGKLVVK